MRVFVAIPCMDLMHTDFVRCLLGMEQVGQLQFTFAQGSLIYDSRNQLANIAIQEGFDRVLWLDSDIVFGPELLKQLSADMDAGAECVSALYFSRRTPIKPVAYKRCALVNGTPTADSFLDYPRDSLFPVEAIGMGAALMTTELLRQVRDRYGLPFSPAMGFGEDLSFCMRAREMGKAIFCDSRVRCGHVGLRVYDEEAFQCQNEKS